MSDATDTIGTRIRRAREAKGLRKAALARILKVSGQAITQWENGTTRPSSSRLEQVAAVLDTSLTWLLTGTGDATADDDVIRQAVALLRSSGPGDEPGALDAGLIALAAVTTFDRLKAINSLADMNGREFWRECVGNYTTLRDTLVEFGAGTLSSRPSSSD